MLIAPMLNRRANKVLAQAIELQREIEGVARRLGHPSPPDFFQDFILHVLENPQRFKTADPGPGVVICAAKRRVIAYHRTTRRIPIVPRDVEQCYANPDDSIPWAASEQCRWVSDALNALRPQAREIVERRVFLEEPSADVAKCLGMTPSGVRSSYKLSRERLRRLLSDATERTEHE